MVSLAMRRIIGIDPGSRYTGYGIVDSDGRNSQHVVSGRIHTGKEEFCARLGIIYQGIEEIIAEYSPFKEQVARIDGALQEEQKNILDKKKEAQTADVEIADSGGR